MTEEGLRELLARHGWYLSMIKRDNTRYAYAKRRKGQRVITKYIKSERKFSELTSSFVGLKIQIA